MTRPVTIGALAERDIKEARVWFDAREPGLGDQFFERVNETVSFIASNSEIYPIVFSDARRAPVKAFKYSVWYRIAHDSSIVVACLSDRREPILAQRRALRRVEPT